MSFARNSTFVVSTFLAVGCGPSESASARDSGWNPDRYQKGTTIARGRVPGRPDRHEEEPDLPTETQTWNGWNVSLKPPVVSGHPGEKHDAIVRIMPPTTEAPDGTGDDENEAGGTGAGAPVAAAPQTFSVRHGEWAWLALAMKDVDIHPEGSLLRLHVVIPFDDSVEEGSLPTEPFGSLPGPQLDVRHGEVVATAAATPQRDASDIPRGVGVEVDGRNVRVLHSLGRRDYQDCGHELKPRKDFELQRLDAGRFLIVGVVDEVVGECQPGGPHNPRLEAALTVPDAGELRVAVFTHHADRVGPYWAISNVTVEIE